MTPDRRVFPSEILLSIIEARLASDRPGEALGIASDASFGEACETYKRVLAELARFQSHPIHAPRVTAATRRLRFVLLAFLRGAPEVPYSPIGITRRR